MPKAMGVNKQLQDDGITPSKFEMWGFEGGPFARYHYRAAPLDEPWVKEAMQEKIWAQVEDFKKQVAESEDEPSTEAIESAEIPEGVAVRLRKAFRRRDKKKLLEAIEEAIAASRHNELTARILVLKEMLGKSWGPELQGVESAIFIVEAIQPILPQGLKDLAKETLANMKTVKKGGPVQKDVAEKVYPDAVDMSFILDASCTISQARSTDESWATTYGVMGAHPGVYFGCHCAATYEYGGLEFGMGENPLPNEVTCPQHVEFDRRYPRKPYNWYGPETKKQ